MKDTYLRQNMDKDGWAPVSVVASFNRVASATADFAVIVQAVKDSEIVEIQDGIKVSCYSAAICPIPYNRNNCPGSERRTWVLVFCETSLQQLLLRIFLVPAQKEPQLLASGFRCFGPSSRPDGRCGPRCDPYRHDDHHCITPYQWTIDHRLCDHCRSHHHHYKQSTSEPQRSRIRS